MRRDNTMQHKDTYVNKNIEKINIYISRLNIVGVGYAKRSLYASTGQSAEGVPTNNQSGR